MVICVLFLFGKQQQTFPAKVLAANGVEAGMGAAITDFLAAQSNIRLAAVFNNVPSISR